MSSLSTLSLRSRLVVAAGGLVVAIALVIGILRISGYAPFRSDPIFDTKAAMRVVDLGSPEGVGLISEFNAFGFQLLERRDGIVTWFDVSWSAQPAPDRDCQVQLALHHPPTWHLVGWTSNHEIMNATINSWGVVNDRHAQLRDVQTTIMLAPEASGEAILVWRPTGETEIDTNFVKAYVVYACGDRDKSASVQQVVVTT